MLDNLYTTRMSASTKTLQNRFSKIRSKSGRISKLMALCMSAILVLSVALAMVVMAAVDGLSFDASEIEFSVNGEIINFKNKPFVENNTVYIPLRELFEKLGIMDNENSEIEWYNGNIGICIARSEGENEFLSYFHIGIGDNQLGIGERSGENKDGMIATLKLGLVEEAPPVLKDNTTYVSYEFIDYMLDRGAEKRGLYNMSCVVKGSSEGVFTREKFINAAKEDEWGITLSVRNIRPAGLHLNFLQSGGNPTGELQFGELYELYKYENGQWTEVPKLLKEGEYAFNLVAYHIFENQRTSFPVRWKWLYGELSPGTYKIKTEVMDYRAPGDFDKKEYEAEFIITDFKAYITPFLSWPVNSDSISRAFDKDHKAVDIAAPSGEAVYAATSGTVTETGFDAERGNYIVITSDNNIVISYEHLLEINVAKDSKVTQRDIVGKVGNTGMSTGAHLHFSVMINGEYYNPELLY